MGFEYYGCLFLFVGKEGETDRDEYLKVVNWLYIYQYMNDRAGLLTVLEFK